MIHPNAFFSGFIYGFLRHSYRLSTSRAYRANVLYRLRYGGVSRNKEIKLMLDGQELIVPDAASFISMHEEIYCNEIYEISMESPKILDLGANMGVSVLWFKKRYPSSKIVAYEADPNIFQCLSRNTAHLSDVTLKHEAVWHENDTLVFSSDGADGGRIGDSVDLEHQTTVDARSVAEILGGMGPFDFVKMDIEGAESQVVPACRGHLKDTKYVFCEYHSKENEPQDLNDILTVLKDEGFRCHIQTVNVSRTPFMYKVSHAGFDMQLNIFAWK